MYYLFRSRVAVTKLVAISQKSKEDNLDSFSNCPIYNCAKRKLIIKSCFMCERKKTSILQK